MTDVLTERFAALADPTDTRDWLEVERRGTRRHRRVAPLLALAAAAILATSAYAAHTAGWVFHDASPIKATGVVSVQVDGTFYALHQFNGISGATCVTVMRGRSDVVAEHCFAFPVTDHPLSARIVRVGDHRIWFGVAVSSISRLSLANSANHFDTWRGFVTGPAWIVAFPASFKPQTISGYDTNGGLVVRRTAAQALR